MKPIVYSMNDALVVSLEGEFDAHVVAQLRDDFTAYSEAESNVLINMKDVYFIDSSGIGALVFLFKRLVAKGLNLSICGVNGQPRDLFELLHLDKTVKCYPSEKDYILHRDDEPQRVA
ncbi:anti-sigma factor antagonist [Pseudomonadota bacterium]